MIFKFLDFVGWETRQKKNTWSRSKWKSKRSSWIFFFFFFLVFWFFSTFTKNDCCNPNHESIVPGVVSTANNLYAINVTIQEYIKGIISHIK